jgi:hypothetical protein
VKKVIFAVLLVVALSLVLVTPILADQGGVPNDDAVWGQQWISAAAHCMGGLHLGTWYPIPDYVPMQHGQGGVPGDFGITHGP